VFSPDGQLLVLRSTDGVQVWDIARKTEVASISHQGLITDIVFSPDGQLVVTRSEDDTAPIWEKPITVRVWDIARKSEVASISHEQEDVREVVFSPDSRYLATVSVDGVRIWDIVRKSEVASISHEEEDVREVVFSPNSQLVATSNEDGTVRVWHIARKTEIASISYQNHGLRIWGIVFSADSQLLAARSRDGVQVWDITRNSEVARVPPEWWLDKAVFSHDGRYLATSSKDTTEIWILDPEELVDAACARLTRNLTLEEWQQYLGDEPYRKTCPNLPGADEVKTEAVGQQPSWFDRVVGFFRGEWVKR
jgi:WD40 repeat protein